MNSIVDLFNSNTRDFITSEPLELEDKREYKLNKIL